MRKLSEAPLLETVAGFFLRFQRTHQAEGALFHGARDCRRPTSCHFAPLVQDARFAIVNTPERSTAAAFPRYLTGEVVADSAALQWPGLFARHFRFLLVVSVTMFAHFACGSDDAASAASSKPAPTMKIRIRIGEKTLTATMRDTATTKDFMSLLPLQLNLKDYAGTEKISDLPRKLITKGSPSGSDPSVGDIAYYAPWGNLAIFYKDFGYSEGLIILGKLDSGIETLTAFSAGKVTIERNDQ